METCALLFYLGMMARIRREGDLHELDSTTTSFTKQTKLLASFQTFHTVATEVEQTELLVPFRTFHRAETFMEHNSSLRRWIEAHEYSFERS